MHADVPRSHGSLFDALCCSWFQDDLYLDHVLECIQDAVMRTMGPILALQYARQALASWYLV